MPPPDSGDFDRVGGEPVLRSIVTDFVGRCFDDAMIGFMFEGKSRSRIIEMEFRLAAQQLGGPWAYDGRGIREAHARLPIMGGHFARRRQILKNTLGDKQVPQDIIERWLEHVDALRDDVLGVGVDDSQCNHALQGERLE